MPEALEIIRACDELKRRDYFTEAARAEIVQPRAEHVLEQRENGEWDLRPEQFGPAQVTDALKPEAAQWTYSNPYAAQVPWVRIRARTKLAAFGVKRT